MFKIVRILLALNQLGRQIVYGNQLVTFGYNNITLSYIYLPYREQPKRLVLIYCELFRRVKTNEDSPKY